MPCLARRRHQPGLGLGVLPGENAMSDAELRAYGADMMRFARGRGAQAVIHGDREDRLIGRMSAEMIVEKNKQGQRITAARYGDQDRSGRGKNEIGKKRDGIGSGRAQQPASACSAFTRSFSAGEMSR